jgi:hypothetical protein
MTFLFAVKHHSTQHELALASESTVHDLQTAIAAATAVPVSGQTVLGLSKAKPMPSAATRLADIATLKLAPKINRLVLMGVTAERREAVQAVEAELVAEREAEREAAERAALEASVREEQLRIERDERRREIERQEAREAELAERARAERAARRAAAAAAAAAADDADGDEVVGNADDRRLNASFDASATLEVELPLFSLSQARSVSENVAEQLHASDKVLLPSSVLADLSAARVAPPFTFCVRVGERCTHVRAVEFSANDCIVLSAQLLADLGATHGQVAKLTTAHLPQATKLQLQPTTSSWVDLDPELRDAILTHELRNYSSATLGGTLSVRFANQVFIFAVRHVEPISEAHAVSLNDVDVEVDVIEPATLPPPIVPLRVDEPALSGQKAGANEPAFFSLQLQASDVGQRFRVRVTSSSPQADPDLFASQLSLNKRPSPMAYEWQSQLEGSSEELMFECGLDGPDQVRPDEPFFVSVCAYGGAECVFEIALQRTTDTRLGDGAASAASAADSLECFNCGRRVPRASHALHELGCRRDSYQCEVCHEVLPRRGQAKHVAVRHKEVLCTLGCGARLTQDQQAAHRRDVCPFRTVACLYCPLAVTLRSRGAHQGQCGNRTATCKQCGEVGKRNTMKRHCVEVHGVFPKAVKPTMWH